jgi:hypothetical protein
MSVRHMAVALSFACCAATALAAGCAEQKRGIGEQCLKDDDCLSGICAGLQCSAAPPLLDGSPGAVDAGGEAGPGDGSAPVDANADASPGQDAGFDAGIDAGVDAGSDAPEDAPADVASAG